MALHPECCPKCGLPYIRSNDETAEGCCDSCSQAKKPNCPGCVAKDERIEQLEAAARPALVFMECYPGTERECSGCDDGHECPLRALRALVPTETLSDDREDGD